MKKILFIAAAMCAAFSCTKEQPAEPEKTPIVFTASASAEASDEEPDSKITVDDNGKLAWVTGDEISISNDTETKIYVVSGWDEHRVATLAPKDGTGFTEEGIYTATYGNINNQWYDENHPGSNCTMAASTTTADGLGEFKFKNTCGMVAVTANTGSNAISIIRIGDCSLNFPTPITLNGTYKVAVPATDDTPFSFTDVTFVKNDGSKHTKTISSAKVERNQLRKMDTKTYFSTAEYSGFEPVALPGVFVLKSGKKICFSRGNVYTSKSTATDYKMEAEQYYCNSDKIPESQNHYAKFSWTQSGTGPYASQFSSEDNSVFPGWRLLTVAEFEELLGYKEWKSGLAFNDKSCDICFQIGKGTFGQYSYELGKAFFPEGFVWDEATMGAKPTKTCQGGIPTVRTEDNYKALTSAGAVILIANGYDNSYVNYGAYYWFFNGTDGTVVNFTYSIINWTAAKYNSSVRLVKEIN